ncbi:MAG TPA: acyl-CoA dehydrogenase [Myxococcota bacterium]|nr:acyl-CoA dehydrogenase [Myxococcota bacterium]
MARLVDLAKRLAPELAAAAPGDDALRRLSDATWKQLVESRILRALQPARFGGGEAPFPEFVDAALELARASASAGWVAGVIGVHPWQVALFPEEAQQELWGRDPSALPSSSYNPTGKAVKVAGGWELSGRWSFSSGCDHARGVVLGAAAGARELPGGGSAPDLRSFLLLAGQYEIDDNWHVAGLRATGSKDIVVTGAFVPEHRTQSHLDYQLGAPLPGQVKNDGPLYRMPFTVVFNMALASATLGSARGFLDHWVEHSKPRFSMLTGRVADDPFMQRRLAEATWDLDAAVTLLRADAAELWERALASQPAGPELRARMRWNMNRGCEVVGRAVSELFHSASGRSVFLKEPLQRRFQDVHAALAHAFLASDTAAKAVGGAVLGTSKPEVVM